MIKDVCAKYTTLSPDTLKFLFDDGEVKILPFIGLSNDPEDAVDYIVKSVTDYSDLPLIASPDNILLLIRVPSGYYIDERSKEKLLSALKTKLGFTLRHIHVRTAEEVEDLHITVVFLERNK